MLKINNFSVVISVGVERHILIVTMVYIGYVNTHINTITGTAHYSLDQSWERCRLKTDGIDVQR